MLMLDIRAKTRRMRSSILLVLLLSCLVAFSGPRDFNKLVYNADKEFNGIFIYTIVQDDDGFLWIGSDDGLYRFDGREMLNMNDQDSTINSLITASTVSPDGHLYFGYYEGGVSVVEHGRYRKLIQEEQLPNKVVELKNGVDNVIWALTQNKGLARIDQDSITYHAQEDLKGVVCHDFFVANDRLLIATNEGLYLFEENGNALNFVGVMPGTEYVSLNAVYQDDHDDNLVWLGSNDGLFTHYKDEDHVSSIEGFPEHVEVSSISKDDLNTLWVGTKNHGLIELDLLGTEVDAITFFDKTSGFESNQIGEVYVDHENEVWVGTFGRGLVQLNRAYFHHYELFNSIGVEGIHSLANYRDDDLLLATEVGLVHVYRKFMRDSLVFMRQEFMNNYSLQCLSVAGEEVWAGSTSHGLLKVDIPSREVIEVTIAGLEGKPIEFVREVQMDSNGDLWVSVAGNGVFHLDKNGSVLARYNTRSGFYHNEIYAIYPDTKGNVWFGSHATGLAVLLKNGQIDYLTKDKIFPAYNVNNIIEDDQGNIWIGTEGSGIYKYDGESFEQYTEKSHNILSDFCNALAVDEIGQIWIGHRLGVTLVKPEMGIVRTFNHPGELGETESELNAVVKDRHGNIFFGNPFGITKVNLPQFNFAEYQRQTHIKNIRLFYQNVDLLAFSSSDKIDDHLPEDLKFPFDQNHLTFDFVSINLRNPDAIYYQYMLEGYDKTWTPITKDNRATYTNLDPGNYTFKVRESDHKDNWNASFESINVNVNYPYWEMWWFYLLQIGLIFAIVSFTYFISGRLKNQFVVRLMVYVSLFIAFEYVHTELEPYLDDFSGETPIFQVAVNLVLALCLLPIEIRLSSYFKRRAKKVALQQERELLNLNRQEA